MHASNLCVKSFAITTEKPPKMPNCLLRVSISLANKRVFPVDKEIETHLLRFDIDRSFQQCLEASVAAFRKISQSKKITPDEMAKVVCKVSDGDGAATGLPGSPDLGRILDRGIPR